jgi:F-box-like
MTRRRTSLTQRPALVTIADWYHTGQLTIDMLPDNALLKIFDSFVDDNDNIDAWHLLVHVCRKWRNVVFEPSRRLNLQLHYIAGRPQAVRELLDILVWPDSPIAIKLYDPPTRDVDNIVAALALAHPDLHPDRDFEISLGMVATSLLEVIFAAMQVPFSAQMRLKFLPEPIPPDSFSDGSTPHLRPFPGLPMLLLSATDLVRLTLRHIPHSGYISPEAMVTCLATLTKLEFLGLDFESPRSCPDRDCHRLPLPPTRPALPALTKFEFRGVSEYLEDLVARINAPLLEELYIIFFHQLLLDTPHLVHFIKRTPKLTPHNEAQIMFLDDAVQVLLGSTQQVILRTSCRPSDWQLSFVAQVCHSFLSLVPALEHLFICEGIHSPPHWQDDIENSQWLDLLDPFRYVKSLHLSEGIVPRIAPAIQELVEGGVAGVLPALDSLFLEDSHPSGLVEQSHPSESYISKPVQEAIGMFIAARQLSRHTTNSYYWRGRGTSVISQRFTGLFD